MHFPIYSLTHFLKMGDVQLVATMASILKNAPPPPPRMCTFFLEHRITAHLGSNLRSFLCLATSKPAEQADFFSLHPPTFGHPLPTSRSTAFREGLTRGREQDRSLSPLQSPGLSRPPTSAPANTSSWSILNSSFNILGGSYGSASLSGGAGSTSSPSGFNIGSSRGGGRASSERRNSERRESEVEVVGSNLNNTNNTSSLSRIDLRSPSLPGVPALLNSSDPIPVSRAQTLSERDRTTKLLPSLTGQGRGTASTGGGGGSLRSRVSFNAAATGSTSSMAASGAGGGGGAAFGTTGTGSGAGSFLQKKMAAKDLVLGSAGGAQQQPQQAYQPQQTSRGRAKLGIKASFTQVPPSRAYESSLLTHPVLSSSLHHLN